MQLNLLQSYELGDDIKKNADNQFEYQANEMEVWGRVMNFLQLNQIYN